MHNRMSGGWSGAALLMVVCLLCHVVCSTQASRVDEDQWRRGDGVDDDSADYILNAAVDDNNNDFLRSRAANRLSAADNAADSYRLPASEQRILEKLSAMLPELSRPSSSYQDYNPRHVLAAAAAQPEADMTPSDPRMRKREGRKLSMRLSMEVIRDMLRAQNSMKQSKSLNKLANLG